MPKLTIDNQEVTVTEGTNVLEAARTLGIVIPHFCYHEALGAVGSCRLCAMQFLEGPVTGVKMACMIPAQDGMVVSTTAPEAVELRSHVIEWLMTNHPHDCPVCDEGGECLLQDMTVAGGHGRRRYQGPKATYRNQDLGPFITQEMNRCIACYRCKRTYRDYCGGTDFGVFGSRNRVYFGRYREGRLESPFSGNLVDVCPTGVFTDKTFRFMSRVWDLQEAPSICPHCSLGCSTVPGGRYRELQRVKAGINPATNGFFICDRGRFGYGHANHPERPRAPHIDGQVVSMADGLQATRQKLQAIAAEHGAQSIAFLGSSRASLEANALLKVWATEIGTRHLLYEAHQVRDLAARALVARIGERGASLEDIRQSDLVVLIGADPLAEGPVLALALRQAACNGAQIVVIDPRPVELPCHASHLPLPPERLVDSLAALTDGDLTAFSTQQRALLDGIQAGLKNAERPVLIGGADLLGPSGVMALFESVDQLSSPERAVRAATLLAGPNSFAGALLNESAADFETLIDDLQEGTVKALVCLEADPFREALSPAKAQAALGHLELLVSIDATPSLAAQRADIFLPARVTTEMAGSYINHEGRLQAFLPVMEPGLPIRVTGQGSHPPREFSSTTPGSTAEPAWAILARLLGMEPDLDTIRGQIAANDPRLASLMELVAESDGIKLSLAVSAGPILPDGPPYAAAAGKLPLLPVSSFIGSNWLAHLSAALEPLRPQPTVWLHPDQAAACGLAEGDLAILTTHLGHCHVAVQVSEQMATGLLLTSQIWDSALEGLSPGVLIDCRLEKEAGK